MGLSGRKKQRKEENLVIFFNIAQSEKFWLIIAGCSCAQIRAKGAHGMLQGICELCIRKWRKKTLAKQKKVLLDLFNKLFTLIVPPFFPALFLLAFYFTPSIFQTSFFWFELNRSPSTSKKFECIHLLLSSKKKKKNYQSVYHVLQWQISIFMIMLVFR